MLTSQQSVQHKLLNSLLAPKDILTHSIRTVLERELDNLPIMQKLRNMKIFVSFAMGGKLENHLILFFKGGV